MLSFILRRLSISIPVILFLIIFSYLLMYLAPGGPFDTERGLPPEVMANLEKKYGLDKPLPVQIWNYVVGIVTQFDFGPSFIYKDQTVNDIIAQGFPVTLKYGFWSFVVAVTVGVSLGVTAAVYHNSWLDYLAVGISVGAQVLPNFVMAPILVLVFTLWLGWLPGGGWQGGQWQYMVMPVIALSTSFMASIARITRSSMLETLNANFIRTARAKGLPPHRVLLGHGLRKALRPVITLLGLQLGALLAGAVVTETVFSWPGIGLLTIEAIQTRDYPVVQACVLLISLTYVFVNLLTDLAYAWVDPRIRLGAAA